MCVPPCGCVRPCSPSTQIWDPSSRPLPNPNADISVQARAQYVEVPAAFHSPPPAPAATALNAAQRRAVAMVLEERRTLTFVQGPPGTGKTTTAIQIVCGWVARGLGPILVTAFSNKGVNNLADGLWACGVPVLRVGHCPADAPYSINAWLGGRRLGRAEEAKFLRTVHVIAATCVGAGMSMLQGLDFPFVMMDEAAQVPGEGVGRRGGEGVLPPSLRVPLNGSAPDGIYFYFLFFFLLLLLSLFLLLSILKIINNK